MRVLGPGLLLSALGCANLAYEEAQEAWSQLKPGQSREEVRERIGRPDRTYRVDPQSAAGPQTVEVWLYTYRGMEITPQQFALTVLALAATFAVAAAAIQGGGGGGLGGIGGGKGVDHEPCYRFYIGFGQDGRVRDVTLIEPVR